MVAISLFPTSACCCKALAKVLTRLLSAENLFIIQVHNVPLHPSGICGSQSVSCFN